VDLHGFYRRAGYNAEVGNIEHAVGAGKMLVYLLEPFGLDTQVKERHETRGMESGAHSWQLVLEEMSARR